MDSIWIVSCDSLKRGVFEPLLTCVGHSSYILIAISEILASITGLEYAFTKAPKNMRSLVMAVFLFMTAISSAIGEAFVCTSAPIHPVRPFTNKTHVASFLKPSLLTHFSFGITGLWLYCLSCLELPFGTPSVASIGVRMS
jgi:POT family proton-dependent oligopeptide transporter